MQSLLGFIACLAVFATATTAAPAYDAYAVSDTRLLGYWQANNTN